MSLRRQAATKNGSVMECPLAGSNNNSKVDRNYSLFS